MAPDDPPTIIVIYESGTGWVPEPGQACPEGTEPLLPSGGDPHDGDTQVVACVTPQPPPGG